jgi:hypothetical protein
LGNKRANLAYQVRRQAERLLEHYEPQPLLDRLARAADPEVVQDAVERAIPAGYCAQVFERLNSAGPLSAEWSATLFKARIARWPLLGLIAWPVAAIGAALGSLRSILPKVSGEAGGDAFRSEGLSLEDRVDAVLDRTRAELAVVSRRVTIDLPASGVLARQFRDEAATLAEENRSVVIGPLLQRRPSLAGRFLRWVLPLAVLLWFPLVQPVLGALLEGADGHLRLDGQALALLVSALSARNVLVGLVASLIILAGLVAAVYSRAVRDASLAAERLRSSGPDVLGETLAQSLSASLRRPIEHVRVKLADPTEVLLGMCRALPSAEARARVPGD